MITVQMIVTVALVTAPGLATEKLGSSKEPVEMTAKGGLEVDLVRRVGVARGDVVIRRSDVVVCCDVATAKYAGDRIESVECKGRVVVVRPDGTKAVADVAVFDAGRDTVTLTGRARLRSTQADLQGDRIVYDIGADKLDVRGERSRFRFLPASAPVFETQRKCPL